MNKKQLLELVVRPTLIEMGLHSNTAEQLVMGTICQESHAEYIKQLGTGPALGLAQMEPATHRDIWKNFIAYRPDIKAKLASIMSVSAYQDMEADGFPPAEELIGNLRYTVAMCRVHYLRVRKSLPPENNKAGLAAYWKRYYNTHLGAGTEAEFLANFPNELFK